MCGPEGGALYREPYDPKYGKGIIKKPMNFPSPKEVEAAEKVKLLLKVNAIREYVIKNLNNGVTNMEALSGSDHRAFQVVKREAEDSGWVVSVSEDQRDCVVYWTFKKSDR